MNLVARIWNRISEPESQKPMTVAEANRLAAEQVLRDELRHHYSVVVRSTDPREREKSWDEIYRLETMLRAT